MQFDASNPYHRHMLHYESSQQLSVPELIAKGSVDAPTAAILWLMLERRASYLIAGPTDPTPGVGKTTTLNALLPFYPTGTGLVYTVGMYEDFSFLNATTPGETTVLANEVSDHLRIYMWGRPARRFLKLAAQGYAVASTCHADELPDVLAILRDDLKLQPAEIARIPLIVNIGLVGRGWPPRRRWLTTHFLPPAAPDADPATVTVQPLLVARWEPARDTFRGPTPEVCAALAAWAGMTPAAFDAAVARRATVLQTLADADADQSATMDAILAFRAQPE